jgi:hypothetical protein
MTHDTSGLRANGKLGGRGSSADLNFPFGDDPGVGGLQSTLRRFFVLYRKNGVESATQKRGCDLGRDYQHRERLGNDDDNTDIPSHFLRILSMAFPLASSSTSLSR